MKIGFVLDDSLDKPDGVQQYVLTLGAWLKNEGHRVHYLVGETHRKDVDNVHSLSKNISLNYNKNNVSIPLPAKKQKIADLLKHEKFDVLHVQMPHSPMLAAKIINAAPARTAIVGTFHIVPFSWRESLATRSLRLLINKSLKRFDKIISVSLPAQKFAKKSLKVNSIIIPNAINAAILSRGKRMYKFGGGKLNIVFLGRLVQRKGCMELLKAVEELHSKKRLWNIRVIICGRGSLEKELKNYVHNHHLGTIVHFAGFINELDKPNYLASADIAVFPSLGGESFGIVLIEAMAAGAGVVLAGNNSGYRSVMFTKPDQIIKPSNTSEFAKSLQHFISNSAARQRAKRWQQTQIPLYDVKIVGRQIEKMYEQIIAKKRRAKDNKTYDSK